MGRIKWQDLPQEIQEKMLERQLEQSGIKNPEIFKIDMDAGRVSGGFTWYNTIEGEEFWYSVINRGNFDDFYAIYPKKSPIKPEYHQEFKRMFRVNRIPNSLPKEILEVLEEKNVHEEWIEK